MTESPTMPTTTASASHPHSTCTVTDGALKKYSSRHTNKAQLGSEASEDATAGATLNSKAGESGARSGSGSSSSPSTTLLASTRAETAQAGPGVGSCPCPLSRSTSVPSRSSHSALPEVPAPSSPSPNSHSVPALSDGANDNVITSASDSSTSPKQHSTAQSHTSCELPASCSADLKTRPATASSSPSHHDLLFRQRLLSCLPHPHLVCPSSRQQRDSSFSDHIAYVQADAVEGSKAARASITIAVTSIASSPPKSPASGRRASDWHVEQRSATRSSPAEKSSSHEQRRASSSESAYVGVDQTLSSSPSSASLSSPASPESPASPPSSTSPPSPTSPESPVRRKYLTTRRGSALCKSNLPSPILSSRRLQSVQGAEPSTPRLQSALKSATTNSSRRGQRESLLPKRTGCSSPDEGQSSPSYDPSNSHKSETKRQRVHFSLSPPEQVPPTRSFRPSGSRKSLMKGMSSIPRPYNGRESFAYSPASDQSPSVLEGRYAQAVSSSSYHKAHRDADRQEDTGDVFMRIAREEPVSRPSNEEVDDDTLTSISYLRRTSLRRPLSNVMTSYHEPKSPSRARRRLSDQEGKPRTKYFEQDQTSELSRATTFRSTTNREKAATAHPGDEFVPSRSSGPTLRPSFSAKSAVGYENGHEGSVYAHRRASLAESNTTVGGRNSAYKSSGLNHSRHYGSSPVQGLEGTESPQSTTAPSTVWDELDDLKSRIQRLELTGKLPSTSGAAVARHSEERPATATTVTTMSLSPKRQGLGRVADVSSTTGPQKEAYPILHSALAKSKPFLSSEVYQALEAAAHDAMTLSSMMGGPGQPGPVSSGAASVVGAGGGGAVTDRQLRRKADSVCRSLTELCVALGDETAQQLATARTSPVVAQHDVPATPGALPKSYSSSLLPVTRRTSVVDQLPPISSSPRAMSKFEERRSLMLNSSALPALRTNGSTPNTPVDANVSRRSSLMIARTRRAGTEEPEFERTASVLRSRRAGTEEADENRQSAGMGRNRRGTVGENAPHEDKFRPPSRAGTDVNMLRGQQGREYPSEAAQSASFGTSSPISPAQPRRRFLSTNLHSSRSGGSPGSNGVFPSRRHERQPVEQEPMHEGAAGDASQRQGPPLSKGIAHARASSLTTRRNREGFIATNSGTPTGAYR
ncbi:hypothetical protein E4U60_007912 [Claviceps pazoutovae]|uniref:LPXTG-motif cell wall anchor domain protein n=1 Tax=Claviceps pazoutovae TaxID=1649127 RepID=A0A9P7MEN6_9HYPO|nr:hypothetical protein E4U60_007912 [Claviceps pazoutovae]